MSAAKVVASVLALAVPLVGCGSSQTEVVEPRQETENAGGEATSQIDFDAISKAYREANSPEDFEQRVNEIYKGDEIVSIAVEDQNDQTQLVTGFIDKNGNGTTGYSYDVGVGYVPYYSGGRGGGGGFGLPAGRMARAVRLTE